MAHETIEVGGTTVLRPTADSDLAILRMLFADPGFNEQWGGQPLSDDEIRAKYTGRRSPKVECFIVEDGGSPVGLMQYHVADDGAEGGGMDLVLTPTARGRGVGSRVVLAMVDYLRRRRGWTRITVDPDVTNPRGVNFWTKVGFQPEQTVDCDPDRTPYVLMKWPHANTVAHE